MHCCALLRQACLVQASRTAARRQHECEQAQRAHLEGEAAAVVLLGDGHHQPHVAVDHVLARLRQEGMQAVAEVSGSEAGVLRDAP